MAVPPLPSLPQHVELPRATGTPRRALRAPFMEKRFEARESRPADLQRIAQLVAVCKNAEVEVARLAEESKTLRLELANREANYSRVFSNSGAPAPVGSPLAAAKHLGGAQRRRG